MSIHIRRINLATTRISGSLYFGSQTPSFIFPPQKNRKPFIQKSISINGNLALEKALYFSGRLISKSSNITWLHPCCVHRRVLGIVMKFMKHITFKKIWVTRKSWTLMRFKNTRDIAKKCGKRDIRELHEIGECCKKIWEAVHSGFS